jgi:hypothetical protein
MSNGQAAAVFAKADTYFRSCPFFYLHSVLRSRLTICKTLPLRVTPVTANNFANAEFGRVNVQPTLARNSEFSASS